MRIEKKGQVYSYLCQSVRETMSAKNNSQLDENIARCPGYFVIYHSKSSITGMYVYSHYAYVIANSLVSLPGVIFNVLVIAAYVRNKNLRTPSNMLFIVLAFSDLMVGVIVQPLQILRAVQELLGTVDCKTWAASRLLSYFCCGVSLLTIGIIPIERFITLAFPYRYQNMVTPFRLKLAVAVTWFCILAFVTAHLGVVPFTTLSAVGASLIILTIACVIPMWLWIHRLIRKHRHTIGSMHVVASRERTRQRKGVFRTTGTCYFIVGAVILCYTPSLSMLGYIAFHEPSFLVLFVLMPWAETVMFINSLINPLLLFTRKTSFRENAKELIFCKKSRQAIEQTDVQSSHHQK